MKKFKTMKRLVRNKRKAVWCGVCTGLADYINVDVSLIRITVLITALVTAIIPALIFYFAACIIIPSE